MEKFNDNNFNIYNEKLCKLTVAKENIIRIYYFSIAILIAVFFLTIYLNFTMEKNIFIKLGITEILSVVFFIVVSRILVKNKIKNKFKYFTVAYWCTLILFCSLNSIFSTGSFYSLFPYMLIMSSFCFIPFFERTEILIFSGMQIISLLISLLINNINYTELFYCLIFLAVTSVSANIHYKNFKLNFRYKSKLSVAIRQSETDKLTELLNRRGLEREIDELWHTWKEDKTNIAIIMLDIDFFKKYNDAFGHMEGDECIKKVAKQIKSAIRKDTDFAARVGGEEFFICLSNISSKDAVTWVKRLKVSIEDMKILQAPANFLPYITVSCGLECSTIENNTRFEALYNSADRELYKAKENGRACLFYKGKCFDQRRRSDYKNNIFGTTLKYKI